MINILDCTLRDGGYVNDWNFSNKDTIDIIEHTYAAGIEWIEVGLLTNEIVNGEKTKVSKFEDLRYLFKDRKKCKYVVMVTPDIARNYIFPMRSDVTPDAVRIAFFKNDIDEVEDIAQKLKSLGYIVFLNAMAAHMYNNQELKSAIYKVNKIKPYGFYFVDSFSVMYPNDIKNYALLLDQFLNKDISIGLHMHNAMQLGLANSIVFIEALKSSNREIFVDSSILGMGRGAGNVPTELLVEYLNKLNTDNFNIDEILYVINQIILPMYIEFKWGYNIEYFLVSLMKLNPVWGWFLINNNIKDIIKFKNILMNVPEENKYTFNKTVANYIIKQ